MLSCLHKHDKYSSKFNRKEIKHIKLYLNEIKKMTHEYIKKNHITHIDK